jgi:hypothetical protein
MIPADRPVTTNAPDATAAMVRNASFDFISFFSSLIKIDLDWRRHFLLENLAGTQIRP